MTDNFESSNFNVLSDFSLSKINEQQYWPTTKKTTNKYDVKMYDVKKHLLSHPAYILYNNTERKFNL